MFSGTNGLNGGAFVLIVVLLLYEHSSVLHLSLVLFSILEVNLILSGPVLNLN
jgi:hypothetical protein